MPRRICIVCQSWESGGIESFLAGVLLHMDRAGLEAELVVEQLGESVFSAPLREAGIRITELSGRLNRPANYFRFFRLLKERDCSLVHLNAFQGLSLLYLPVARLAGVPVRIAHSHNTALRRSPLRPLKLLLHRLGSACFSGSATELWACSQAAAAFMFPARLLSGRGFRFIPNGIDRERFRFRPRLREEQRRALGFTGCFVLGSVGRLCDQKNQTFLLDVMKPLSALVPESRLLLVGEGEARSALEEKAEALGIRDSVLFYGVTEHVEALFWAMDVFVFPSRFEGLGIVAVEAQAAGLPTLCSEHVPEEALTGHLAERVPLTEGPEGWAARLAALRPGLSDEEREGTELSPEFEIRVIAEKLRRRYLGEEEHGGFEALAGP